jgi:hypothetical protein
MFVNNYKIRRPHLTGTTELSINIPISQTPWLVNQSDIINTKFIDVEVEAAINPILDYENTRFLPIIDNTPNIPPYLLCDTINYKINMLDSGTYPPDTYWSDVDFVDSDLILRKNSYLKTFLRLDFYDTDIGTNQRLLFFKTIFPETSNLPLASNFNLSFTTGNVLINRDLRGEGFFLYYFKEDVIPTVPKYLYMKATFLNAKNGLQTTFMSSDNPNNGIEFLAQEGSGLLYTRYILKREDTGYYYEIDDTYSTNVIKSINSEINYTVNLYEISVL